MKRTYLFEFSIMLLLISINFMIGFQDPERIKNITKEDGIVETSQAITYFLTACLLFYLFIKSKYENKMYFLKTKRNYFFLSLGFLFILFAGEEISWGQRIFDYNVIDFFQAHNQQKETNIHNLNILHGLADDGKMKTGLYRLLTGNALLYEFFFLFCLFIPLLSKFSKKIRNVIQKIGFPLVPLWIGIAGFLSYIIYELIERAELIGYFQVGEIREGNFAVLFFIGILSIFLNFKNRINV